MEPIRDFVRRHKEEPMFIWYAPFLPHLPHNAPVEYEAPFAGFGLHVTGHCATMRAFSGSIPPWVN